MAAMATVRSSILFCCVCITQVFSCPEDCTCSNQLVNCYGKKLREIPLDIPADTMKLDLGNNEIDRIDSSRFMNLPKLHELLLKYNQISSLEAGTFKYLKNLENLDLGTNNIKNLVPGVFNGLSKLKGIDLTENLIEDIDDSFQNLQTLERLDLGSNKIKTIGGMTFNDLKNLIYLVLPNNQITKIDRFAFRPLQKLSSVILSRNPLKNANALFVKNRQLSYIDLTQCALTRIPSKLPPSLRYLQLRHNNITRIKANAFAKSKLIGILVLDQNEISLIEKGAFGPLKNLQELWLNDNKLTTFPSPISATVKSVYISKNQIQTVSYSDFPAKSSLVTLSLKSNEISDLKPGTFSQLKNLNKLFLGKNKISILKSKTFSGLGKLSTLSLNKNFITNIEKDVFVGLKSLSKLEMAFVPQMVPPTTIEGNILSNIQNLTSLDLQLSPAIAKQVIQSDMLSSVPKLKDINLMDNNLVTLNPEIRTFLKNADVIKIAGNLWHCDKNLLFLKEWINKNLRKFFVNSQIMCSTPDLLRGKKISTLKPSDFVPVTNIPQHTTTMVTTTVVTTPSQRVTSPTKNIKSTTKVSKITLKRFTAKPTKRQFVDRKQTSKKDFMFTTTVPNIKTKTPVVDRKQTSSKKVYTKKVFPKITTGVTMVTRRMDKKTTMKVYTRKLYIKTLNTKQTTPKTIISTKATTSPKPTDQSKGTTLSLKTTSVNILETNKTESDKTSGLVTEPDHKTNNSVSNQTESMKRENTTNNSELSPSTTERNVFDETLNDVDSEKKKFYKTHGSKNGEKNKDEYGNGSNKTEDADITPEADQTKAHENNGNTKIAVIATCVSVVTLIVVILAAILVHRQYRKNKLVYHRALQYRQDYTDVTFFVGEPVGTVAETDFISKPKPRKRSDRGSTSSMTKEDITNDLDQSMKVYTWDDEK